MKNNKVKTWTGTSTWLRQDKYVYEEKVNRWILLKWLIRGSFKLQWQIPYDKKNKGLYLKKMEEIEQKAFIKGYRKDATEFGKQSAVLWVNREKELQRARTETIKRAKKYWYYSGGWHNSNCFYILQDEGVCNCNHKLILKALKGSEK